MTQPASSQSQNSLFLQVPSNISYGTNPSNDPSKSIISGITYFNLVTDIPQLFTGSVQTADGNLYTVTNGVVKRQLPVKKTRLLVGAIGDSITANALLICTPTSAIISGGILTVVVSAAHKSNPVGQFYLTNFVNDAINGIVFTAIAGTVDFTLIAYAPNFPDQTLDVTGSPAAMIINESTGSDWISMASSQSSGGLKRGISVGYAGKLSNYITTKIPALLTLPIQPDIIIEDTGANDIKGGVSPATILANRIVNWNMLKSMGYRVAVTTIAPINNSVAGWSSSWQYGILNTNKLIRDYCRNVDTDLILIDKYKVQIDPLNTTGNQLSGYTSDGLHPSGIGAWAVSTEILSSISKFYTLIPNNVLPTSIQEQYGVSNTINQILDNPLGTLTVGTVTAPCTGSCWTGWTLAQVGTPTTVVGSNPSRSDGFGNNQQVVLTAAAANDGFTLTSSSIAGRAILGQYLSFVNELTLLNCSALNRIEIFITLTTGGKTFNCYLYNSSNSMDISNKTLINEVPELYVHGSGNIQLTIKCVAASSGVSTITLGRPAIWVR